MGTPTIESRIEDLEREAKNLREMVKNLKRSEPAPYCGLCYEKCKNRIHDGKACRGFEPGLMPEEKPAPESEKVLTAGHIFERDLAGRLASKINVVSYGVRMHQNGRLEMWLEFKKYLDEKTYATKASISHPFSLEKAVENLKPWEKDR